jgi:hypothetical protein
MKETVATNAAQPVLEGAPKPESTLVYDAASDRVCKIPTCIPVTEEMLKDVAQRNAPASAVPVAIADVTATRVASRSQQCSQRLFCEEFVHR